MKYALPLLFLLASVCAQAADTRKIRFRALCFQHAGEIKEVLLQTADNATIPVPLYTSAFSHELEATLQNDLVRFVISHGEKDGRKDLQLAASAKAVPGEHQLFLFVPQANAPDTAPYRVLVFDDTESAFPMGGTLLLNFARQPVRFSVGEHLKELPPGGIVTIPQAMKRNTTNQTPVEISFSTPDGRWVPFSSTRWLSLPNQRALAISFIHPVSRQPMVRWYQDIPPWRLPKL